MLQRIRNPKPYSFLKAVIENTKTDFLMGTIISNLYEGNSLLGAWKRAINVAGYISQGLLVRLFCGFILLSP